MESETEQEVIIPIVSKIIFLASSTDWDSDVASLIPQLFSGRINFGRITNLTTQILSHKPKMEFASLTRQILSQKHNKKLKSERKLLSLITQIISLVSSMDLDSQQPKPESELISLINQIITLFKSKPDTELELVSLITRAMRLCMSVEWQQESELMSLISQLVSLKPEPEITSLISHIICHFKDLDWEPMPLISLCPRVEAKRPKMATKNGECKIQAARFFRYARKEYFYCGDCKGEFHEEYEKAPREVKHPLHPKHSLQLVSQSLLPGTRKCYCCGKGLNWICYFCEACDYAMDIACVDKTPLLATYHPKWHEHTLALFPSQTSYPCSLCALTHSSCPLYICPPCDFVVHQNCLSLPRVIRISRHPQHRISFTHSFEQGDWFCSVCRKNINNDYGGYSCVKDNCSYVAHSRCATQSNLWDGIDLEGEPEETEEELEPFVKISDGVIQHFSHQQHHLRLDDNWGRVYDENKLCQACITPIYFGNFYSCMECEFILHETCANLSPTIYHPVHPHLLTLVTDQSDEISHQQECSVCRRLCTGFFYACSKRKCRGFKLNVQCATVSEPLVHASHTHPLFLTSKPEEYKTCGVCRISGIKETFNCVECDFSLCFRCATIPHEVRYKHDKHILTLSYGKEVSTLEYWCEVCERNINPEERFYKCDEYCCVTIHMECLIGKELYMKPGLSWPNFMGTKVHVLPNNHSMSRPICSGCTKRCPQNVVFKSSPFIYCSTVCGRAYGIYL